MYVPAANNVVLLRHVGPANEKGLLKEAPRTSKYPDTPIVGLVYHHQDALAPVDALWAMLVHEEPNYWEEEG